MDPAPAQEGPREDAAVSAAAAPLQVSIVTPAYREAQNLPVLYERLRTVLDGAGVTWEPDYYGRYYHWESFPLTFAGAAPTGAGDPPGGPSAPVAEPVAVEPRFTG